MLRVDVVTIFPDLFGPFLEEAFVEVAKLRGVLEVAVRNLRDWTVDRHRTVDDAPYGGGPGMVLKPEPLVAAIEDLAGPKGEERRARVILFSPQGRKLDQGRVAALAHEPRLVFVCGRYEGVDQRVIEIAVDEEISVGDYVLSGGELPAMILIEAMARLLPGVLGNPESTSTESFEGGLLEGPHYTRPAMFRGRSVPEVLRSGNHAAVARWRDEAARKATRDRRPDLPAGCATQEAAGKRPQRCREEER
jgi:tRNA (guanine37-N1)-methyltransferase